MLDQEPKLRGCELIDAWLERTTDLQDRRGTASQTDLLAVLGIGEGLVIMAVEAKVDESFGQLVRQWLGAGSDGKAERLKQLCALFGLDEATVGELRYQLFHRTAAAIYEARRFRSGLAILMVQSFCPNATGLEDFVAFFDRVGMTGVGRDKLSLPKLIGGIELRVGWTSDVCPPA